MKKLDVIKFKELIGDVSGAVREAPDPRSIRYDELRGKEVEKEYRRLLKKLKKTLRKLGL